MVKRTQTNPRQWTKNYLSVFDHFVGLTLIELRRFWPEISYGCTRCKTVFAEKNHIPLPITIKICFRQFPLPHKIHQAPTCILKRITWK